MPDSGSNAPPYPRRAPPGRSALLPLALAGGVVAISFAAVFFRKAQPTPPLVAAGIRLAVAAIFLLPFTARAARRGQISRRLMGAGVVAGVLYSVHFGAWVTSLAMTSVAASVTIVTATPILVALWALVSGRDRPTPRLWLAIGLTVVGLGIVGAHDLHVSSAAVQGDGWAGVGAAAMAGYLLLVRWVGDEMRVMAFAGIATTVGAAMLLGAAGIAGIPIRPASPEAFVYLALAALVPQLVGHNLLTWSLRHTTPTVVGIATVGEPVGATIIAWAWLDEAVPAWVAIGCTVTLAGIILALWRRRGGRDVANLLETSRVLSRNAQ